MSNVHHYTQVPKVGWVTLRPSRCTIKIGIKRNKDDIL